MTARPRRRRHRTVFVVVMTMLLMIAAGTLVAVGAMTLLDSEEGEVVAADVRPVVALPSTPNALLAVTDDDGNLTSLVVATLDPSGAGGSIVTIPVNADAGAGFGSELEPLDELFDPEEPDVFRETVESMLAIAIERVAVISTDELVEIIDPLTPVDVDLPEDVIDSESRGEGVVVDVGEQTLDAPLVGEALTARDESGSAYDHHDVDVEIWSRLAETAPVLPPRADPDQPPDTVADLFADLWSGEVSVRDLALSVVVADPDESSIDSVIVDQRDSLLVFAQISPALVSRPNQALSFRVVVRFNEEQLEESDGLFESNSELARRFIGEILFFQGNVVSVETAPAVEGAPEVTRVEVSDPRFVNDLEVLAPPAFGESGVVEAGTVIVGVDVVVTLGTGYIDLKREAAEARSSDTTSGEAPTTEPEAPTTDAEADEPVTSDTVGADD